MALAKQEHKMEQGFNTAGEAIRDGATVEQIQTTYQTAVRVQKPRELAVVEKNCLTEASLAGEACFYGWGAGKDRVEGPSIDCALIAGRNWGNAALEMKPIHETASAYIMEAVFIDLETGWTYPRQFKQSKSWKVHGRMDDNRKADIRFQIGQSKAQRNAIVKALPKWLIDKMIEKAKEGVKEKLEQFIKDNGVEKARQLLLKSLAKYGVTQDRIEFKYDKKYGAWDVDLLVILKGDLRALTDGAESADALYPDPEAEKPAESANGLKPEDMKPGDPATHQGYNDKADKPADPPETDTTADELKELIKKPKTVLEETANKEFMAAFANDEPGGNAFLNACLQGKTLRSTTWGENTVGELAQFLVKLRKRQAKAEKPAVDF